MKFPALYSAASSASDRSQKAYLRLIRLEYALLTLAAILSLDFSSSPIYYSGYALVFVCSLIVLVFRSSTKPEQNWYKARALAESIKTASWRFVMRAEPYGCGDSEPRTRAEFREMLSEVLRLNDQLGEQFGGEAVEDEQVSAEMIALRAASYEERRARYLSDRIIDQRTWYGRKATTNKDMARVWLGIGSAVYIFAIASVLLRIAIPSWKFWPTEPLTVVAASIVGWMQTKRFRELATSYALTAQEIGIMEGRLKEIQDDAALGAFVNEAEQGFSREHTQWVARQQTL